LFEGRLNKISGLGAAILFSAIPFLALNPFSILVSSSTITLRVVDLEGILLWTGAAIGWTGILRATKPLPKKMVIGTLLWVTPLFYMMEMEATTGLIQVSLGLDSSTVYGLQVGSIVLGIVLYLRGYKEFKESRIRSKLLQTSPTGQ
jgi:hypothetical protein